MSLVDLCNRAKAKPPRKTRRKPRRRRERKTHFLKRLPKISV